MDLPLEALKRASQEVPVEQGSHSLRWTPENGFVLALMWNGQWHDIRFDFDDKLDTILADIQSVTGIPMEGAKEPEVPKEPSPQEDPQQGEKVASSRESLGDRILKLIDE